MPETIQLRSHHDAARPTLIFLPGLHGDWTLVTGFRLALAGRARWVEFTYPRTLTWSLTDYAQAVAEALVAHGVARGWVLAESFSSQVAWELLGCCPDQVSAANSPEQWVERATSPSLAATCRQIARQPASPLYLPPDEANRLARKIHFQPCGLILAGGFVKHPANWAVRWAERFCRGVSLTWLTRLLFGYAKVARYRHRHSPEKLAGLQEFLARRTELDKRAAQHRLHLIAHNDPRPIARRVALPVFALSGFFDPVAPWPLVLPWLKRNCPGYRAGKVLWKADHNVLGTASEAAAEQILRWISRNPEVE